MTKKARVDAAASCAAASGLASLPPALVDAVLQFDLGDDFYHGNGRRYWSRQLGSLHAIAQVSKEWLALADDAASLRVLQTVKFKYVERSRPMTRAEMLDLRRKLTLRRFHVRRLIVEDLPDFGASGEAVWSAALSHAPKLQSLDLDTGDLLRPPSNRIVEITRAAARQCLSLQRLMYPSRMSRPLHMEQTRGEQAYPHRKYLRAAIETVFDSLPMWAKQGGLRHLRLPLHHTIKSAKEANEYFDKITQFCPRIEILDGFAATVSSVEIVTCGEKWLLDLATWEEFCARCDQLTLFDWVPLPFATRFFELFGATPKPRLINMTISAAANWNWARYFRKVDPSTQVAIEATGYGGLAKNVESVVAACPNLEELRVEWHDTPWRTLPRASTKSKVNPEIFGDDFCEAVARHCKKLTSLRHSHLPTISPTWSPESIATLTDRSLRALATLPRLDYIEMCGATITADGLFSLVMHHEADTRRPRDYFFSLGDTLQDGVTSMVFYTVLEGFLERLVQHDGELPFADRPVMVQLINANKSVVEEGWSAAYFSNVLLLVEKVKTKLPTLQMSGLVWGYDEEYGVMKRVIEFTLGTKSAKLPDWSEDATEVEAADDEIDDVFMNRTYHGDDEDDDAALHHSDSDDEDDSDDDDDANDDGDEMVELSDEDLEFEEFDDDDEIIFDNEDDEFDDSDEDDDDDDDDLVDT